MKFVRVVALAAFSVAVQAPVLAVEKAIGSSFTAVAAYVNGAPIRKSTLEQALALAGESRGAQSADREGEKREVLSALINTELLYQECERRGIRVDESLLDLETEVYRRSPDAFPNLLHEPGETPEHVTQRLARKMVIEKLIEQEVLTDIAVSSAQVREFYEEHRNEFFRPEQIRLGHILVKKGATETNVDTGLRRATALWRRIVEGESFSEVARCCSDESGSAQRGGDMGYFSRGDLPDSIEEVAFQLETGQVSRVVADADGYHLVRAIARLPDGYIPIEKVESHIRAVLETREKSARLGMFLETLRSRANVVIVAPR